MPSSLLAATFDAHSPARVAQFWAGMLGRPVIETTDGALLPGTSTQLGLRFTPSRTPTGAASRMHLHMASTDDADQQETVAAALARGARHLDVGQLPDEEHVVLADPGGYPFCVIEPGNSFLTGCGRLGEFACDGTREVGLFWAQALAWPLVWDQDQETAIQSPQGGTKVAWSGSAGVPQGPSTQRFDLVAPNGAHDTEAERLMSLGATRLETDAVRKAGVRFADPDGNEFRLLNRDKL